MGYFGRLGARWLSALAAAVFEALLVRPSRSTFDAADAAFALVFLAFAMRTSSVATDSRTPPLTLKIVPKLLLLG